MFCIETEKTHCKDIIELHSIHIYNSNLTHLFTCLLFSLLVRICETGFTQSVLSLQAQVVVQCCKKGN